jgi:hypothetical protein
MVLATFVYSAYYIGRLIFRGTQHPVIKALVGGVILIVALQIPWLNLVIWLAMVFFGLGAQLLEIHRQRPWHIAPAPAVAPQLPGAATFEPQGPADARGAMQQPGGATPPPPPAGTPPPPTPPPPQGPARS